MIPRPVRPTSPSRRRARPAIEPLEARWTPAVFNVNTLADGLDLTPGLLSLRQAIRLASATPGGNTINLTVSGVYRLSNLGPGGSPTLDILPTGGDLSIVNTHGPVEIVGNRAGRVFDIDPSGSTASAPFTVTMLNLAIIGGVAAGDSPVARSGGGIRVQGNASLVLDYSDLIDDAAQGDGGGVAMVGAANGPRSLTLYACFAQDDSAGGSGGAVAVDGPGTVALTATWLTGNTALNGGGGLWLGAVDGVTANATINGGLIARNAADHGVGGGVGNSGNGGVLFDGVDVQSNYAGSTGGGFGDAGIAGTLTVLGSSIFQFNGAAGGGGGIQEDGPQMYVVNSTIQGNSTEGNGGGILASGIAAPANSVPNTLVIINNTSIVGNVATNGGGIEDAATTLNLAQSVVSSNLAIGVPGRSGGSGGGLDVANAAQGHRVANTVSVALTMFANDIAGSGGGISQAVGTLDLDRSEFVMDAANDLGGGVDFSGGTLVLTASTFFANAAGVAGGGLEVVDNGEFPKAAASTVTNATFVANAAGSLGGGADFRGTFTWFVVMYSDTFTGNVAASGGGMATEGPTGRCLIYNTVIALDTARSGAGPDVSNPGAQAVIDGGGNFVGNLSGSRGFRNGTRTGDPKLAPLSTNGGPLVGTLAENYVLFTQATLPGSPLIAAGVSNEPPSTDARGVPRPVGAAPTIGAYQQT